MTGFLGGSSSVLRSNVIGATEDEIAPHSFSDVEQAAAQAVLDAKSSIGREQGAFDAQMKEAREARQQLLRGDVPAALFAAVDTAHQALLEARRTAAQARQALEQHERTRPLVAADVPTYTRRKRELADDLTEYENIAADAHDAHRFAMDKVEQAMQQAWIKRRTDAQAVLARRATALGQEIQAKQTALNELRQAAQRELEHLQDAVNQVDRFA